MKKNTFEQKVRDGSKAKIKKAIPKKEAPAEVKSTEAKLESSNNKKAKKITEGNKPC